MRELGAPLLDGTRSIERSLSRIARSVRCSLFWRVQRRTRFLFLGRFGCYACHGDPKIEGSNIIGPHLGNIGIEGSVRIEGVPAHQYIYESILDPNGFIAPLCQNGQPCAETTAMPEYASLMTLENVADILAYLLEQRRQGE